MSLRREPASGAGIPLLRQRFVGDEQAARRWLQDRRAEGAVGGLVRELDWSPGYWEAVAVYLDTVDARREMVWMRCEQFHHFGMEWGKTSLYSKGATHDTSRDSSSPQ